MLLLLSGGRAVSAVGVGPAPRGLSPALVPVGAVSAPRPPTGTARDQRPTNR